MYIAGCKTGLFGKQNRTNTIFQIHNSKYKPLWVCPKSSFLNFDS
jgi:hypothetical protein